MTPDPDTSVRVRGMGAGVHRALRPPLETVQQAFDDPPFPEVER